VSVTKHGVEENIWTYRGIS